MISGMLFSVAIVIYNVIHYWGMQANAVASPYAQYILCDANSYSSIITIIFPFFIILPFALCHSEDKNKDTHLLFLASRCTRKDFFLGQSIVVVISTFIVLLIPLIFNIVLNYIIFPDNGMIPGWGATYSDNVLNSVDGSNIMINYWHIGLYLKKLFLLHPFWHNILFAFNAALFGSVLALFAYACSLYIESKSIFIFMPVFILLQIIGMLSSIIRAHPELVGNVNVYMTSYIVTGLFTHGRDYRVYFAFIIILLMISGCLIMRKIKKEELK